MSNQVIYDFIGEVKFAISARSFYQVNPVQTEVPYNKTLEYAGATGTETIIDAYCGIGTISLFLAQKAKLVYGVEIVPEAIDDANRKGCNEALLTTILQMQPDRVVYVSCNPSTLARDLKVLADLYVVKEVQPVDMFPHTDHVECVVRIYRED